MPYIQLENGRKMGQAIAPPSSEIEQWTEVAEDDPLYLAPLYKAPIAEWDDFFEVFEPSDISMRVLMSKSPALLLLVVEFGKRSTGAIDGSRLIHYWNQTVLGMATRFTPEQCDRLNDWAIEFHLPVRVLANSNLTAAAE